MKYIMAFLVLLCGSAVGGPNAQRFLVLDSAKPDNVWSQTFTRGESVWLRCDLYARGSVYTNPCGGYLWYATNAAASTGVKIYSSYNEPGFVWFLVSSSNSLGLSPTPAAHYAQVVITNSGGTVFADWGRGTFVTRNGGGVTGVGVAPSVTNINIGTYSWQGVFPESVIPGGSAQTNGVTNYGARVNGQPIYNGVDILITAAVGSVSWPAITERPTIWPGTATDDVARAAVATAWQNPASATNWTWTSDGTQITLTGYTGPNAVVIPDMLDGLPVTGFGVVLSETKITGISGGANVAHISASAFLDCTNLTSVSLPSVAIIEGEAFAGCTRLSSLLLPVVTSVQSTKNMQTVSPFSGCSSLESISLLEATNIADSAFVGCINLKSVYFGQNAPEEALDVYGGSPNVTNYVTNPQATGWGATWNGRPVVRPALYSDVAFQDNNTATNITSVALIKGTLSTKTPGAEVGKLTLSTSYAGADPAGRNDLVLTATGAESNASLLAIAGDVTIGGTLTGGGVVTNGGATINGAPITNGAAFTITGGGGGGGISNIVVAGVGGTLTGSGSNVVAEVSLAELAGAGILTNGQHNVSLGTNITMAGPVGIGTTTPDKTLVVSASSGQAAVVNTAASSTTGGGTVGVYHNDGAAMGDGDRLGLIVFGGVYSGAVATANAASIEGFADGLWSTSSTPTRLIFKTTQGETIGSAANRIERMRITSDGSVGIGTNNPAAKLHVNGGVLIEGATTNVGELVVLGGGNVITNGGSGSSLTGITAAQVGAVSTNGGSIAYVDLPAPGTSAGSPAAGAARLESQSVNGQAWINMVQSDGSSFRVLRDTVFTGYNYTGGTLTNGAAVAFGTGMVSTAHWLQLARADSESTMPAQGIVIGGSITNGGVGNFAYITRTPTGYLPAALSALPYGSPLYISTTTAGGYQSTVPGPGYYRQSVGFVNFDGAMDVRIQQSDLMDNSAISREWNLWPGSNSTVLAGAKEMRLIGEGFPAGSTTYWTNSVTSNGHYIAFASPAMGLTVLNSGKYQLNINMGCASDTPVPTLAESFEVYLRATNGVETELTDVSGTTPQNVPCDGSFLEYIFTVTIATDTVCAVTDSFVAKLKSSNVTAGRTAVLVVRGGAFSAPIPSGQFTVQSEFDAHTTATIAGGVHGGLTAAGIAAAGGVTGAVYSAESGAPSISGGLLTFPTNTFGGGTGGGISEATATNIARSVAFDSGVDPYILTSATSVAIVRIVGTNTYTLTMTTNVTLTITTNGWAGTEVGRFSLDVNPGAYTLAFDTTVMTNTTVLDVPPNKMTPFYFRKAVGESFWRVRQ